MTLPEHHRLDTDSLVQVTDTSCSGPHGPVPVRQYGTRSSDTPALVWVHGGAFSRGDLKSPESHSVGLGLASRGLYVVSVDYRLVPQWSPFRAPAPGRLDGIRFPVPLEDVRAAYRAVVEMLTSSFDPTPPVVLGGASAGACLAAAATFDSVSTGSKGPAKLVLAYPTVHSRLPDLQPELRSKLRGFRGVWQMQQKTVERMNRNYAGSLESMADPRAFPGGADLSGFPPTLILNAEFDSLRASGDAFAKELQAHRVPVTNEFLPGTRHGFLNKPKNPAMSDGLDRMAAWIYGATC